MYNMNQGYQNNMQGGYNNPNNYNMAQLAPNYVSNTNNRPPIPFTTGNVNRKIFFMSEIIANGQKFAGESKHKL